MAPTLPRFGASGKPGAVHFSKIEGFIWILVELVEIAHRIDIGLQPERMRVARVEFEGALRYRNDGSVGLAVRVGAFLEERLGLQGEIVRAELDIPCPTSAL